MQYLRLRLLIGCRMLLTLTSYCHVISTISGKEYCLNQSFEARCGPQEVVMVHQASYGRMRLGSCVQKDYGSMGCHADVTEVLSGACSGKESCGIVNMEAFFSSFNRCPSDLKSYLEANVTCLAVQRHPCSSDGLIHLAAQTIGSGNVISGSVVMAMSNADAEFMECPFVIEGKPGQRINITLSDFFELPINPDPNNNNNNQQQQQQQHQHIQQQQQQTHQHKEGKNVLREKYNGDEDNAEHLCKKYATIWDGSEVKNLVMCRRNAGVFGRLESVYVSSSNKVRLRIEVGINQRFIVTYNVIGCPFPDLPHDAHIVSPSGRESRWSMPKITIRCNQSEDSLLLTCNNGIYVSDNQAALNCTRKLPQGLPEDWSSSSEIKSFFPYGISMLLVAVVATCICLITLAIGLLYVNRKDRRMQNARKLTSLMNGGSVPFDMIAIPGAYDHLSTDPNLGVTKGAMYPNLKKGAHFEYPHNRRGECHYSPVTNRNWSGVHGTLTPSSPERRLLIPLTCPETSTIKVTSPIMSATPHFRGNLPLPHVPMDASQDGGIILSEVCSDPSSCMRTTELTTPPTIRCSCTMPKQINKSRLDILPGVIKKLNTERKTRKPFSSSSFDSGPHKRNTFFAPSNTTKSGINSNKPHLNPEQHPGSNFLSSPPTATTASGSASPPTFSTFKPVDVVESCVSGQNRSNNNNNHNGDKFSQQFCSNDQLTRPVCSQNESQWRESSSSSSSSSKHPFQVPVDPIRNNCSALTQRQCTTPKSGRATGVRFTMTANDKQDDQQHRSYKMAEQGSALV